MLNDVFNSGTQSLLNRAMDITWRAKEVSADNIANVDTPGFKRSEVLFQKNLQQALSLRGPKGLAATHARHMQGRASRMKGGNSIIIDRITDSSYRNDGNNVDIDMEMAGLTKANLFYDALSQSMSNEIRLLRLAITGRG
ncbi:MAG: flagellar basal body rod protein FlgB [Syntrophomonadaceae bacterium]